MPLRSISPEEELIRRQEKHNRGGGGDDVSVLRRRYLAFLLHVIISGSRHVGW